MRTRTWLVPLAIAVGFAVGLVAVAAVPKPGLLAKPPSRTSSEQLCFSGTLVEAKDNPQESGAQSRSARSSSTTSGSRADDTVACATCHDPTRGFTDHKPTSEGIRKQKGQRNAPTMLNAMFNATQFWDGRAATLEEQAKLPILNPIEMGMIARGRRREAARASPSTPTPFKQRRSGATSNYDDLAARHRRLRAHAVRPATRRSTASSTGDEKAHRPPRRARGWALFNGKGRCNTCHAGNAVSPALQRSEVPQHRHRRAQAGLRRSSRARRSRSVRSGDQKQIDELALADEVLRARPLPGHASRRTTSARSRRRTLRNIGITAPYMHDGSLATLWDVMDHYNKGGVANPFLDGGMQRLGLTEAEIDDLVAFLFALTDDRSRRFSKNGAGAAARPEEQAPRARHRVAMGKKGDLGDLAPTPTR